MILPRRQFLTGLASLIAAPAVVKYANLMPVRGIVMSIDPAYGQIYSAGFTIYRDRRFWISGPQTVEFSAAVSSLDFSPQ